MARTVHKNDTAAKQAVCEMGVPEHLVQLVIDVHFQRYHEDFSTVAELYKIASDVASSPELQSELATELYQSRLQQQQEAKSKKKNMPRDLEKDGMENNFPEVFDKTDSSSDSDCPPSPMEIHGKTEVENAAQVRLKTLVLENQKLNHRKFCRLCRQIELTDSGVTFLPCGHFITCEKCAEKCDDCPACGKNIMGTVRTFLT